MYMYMYIYYITYLFIFLYIIYFCICLFYVCINTYVYVFIVYFMYIHTYMHVCLSVYTVCLPLPEDARGEHWMPCNWSYRCCELSDMTLLELKLRFFARAAGALNQSGIFLDLDLILFHWIVGQGHVC